MKIWFCKLKRVDKGRITNVKDLENPSLRRRANARNSSFPVFHGGEKFRPGGLFLQSPETFRHISNAIIPFIPSQRRDSKPSNFAVLLVFLTLRTCKKISFSKRADSSLTTDFSGTFEKHLLGEDLNPYLCDTCAVFYQV